MDLHKEHQGLNHVIITYICYSILIVDLVLFEIYVNDSWLSAARWPAAYNVWYVTQNSILYVTKPAASRA